MESEHGASAGCEASDERGRFPGRSDRAPGGRCTRLPARPSEPLRFAVLFIHGASASCDTFLEPEGRSIFDFLNTTDGMDVWLLDWRGSNSVTAAAPGVCNQSADTVAAKDIPAALRFIRQTREEEGHQAQVAVGAHCVGAACLAMSIAAGNVTTASASARSPFQPWVCLRGDVGWLGQAAGSHPRSPGRRGRHDRVHHAGSERRQMAGDDENTTACGRASGEGHGVSTSSNGSPSCSGSHSSSASSISV